MHQATGSSTAITTCRPMYATIRSTKPSVTGAAGTAMAVVLADTYLTTSLPCEPIEGEGRVGNLIYRLPVTAFRRRDPLRSASAGPAGERVGGFHRLEADVQI